MLSDPSFQQHLEEVLECPVREAFPVGGGCIHQAYALETANGRIFLKRNLAKKQALFDAEAEGLKALREAAELRVPEVIAKGTFENHAYLLMEYLEMGQPQKNSWEDLGRSLALLHQHHHRFFGWPHHNFIGETLQTNALSESWVDFLRECRLQPQVKAARGKGLPLRGAEELFDRLDAFFPDKSTLKPSLLHGDLWQGNIGFLDSGGIPLIFDPACYAGHHEMEFAMVHLFGGFPAPFFDAYQEMIPAAPAEKQRAPLYRLYHILNHFNLFGGHYGATAERIIEGLIAQK